MVITRGIYTKIISTKNKIAYEMHKTVNWYLRRNESYLSTFSPYFFSVPQKNIFFVVVKKFHRIMHKMFQDFILAQEPGKAEHLLAFIKKKCVCLNVFSPSESFLKVLHSRGLPRSVRVWETCRSYRGPEFSSPCLWLPITQLPGNPMLSALTDCTDTHVGTCNFTYT